MRRYTLLLCAAGLVLTAATSSWARLWNDTKIVLDGGPTFACGPTPSIALLYGVQPVVSNYYFQGGGQPPTVVHKTAFGWEAYGIQPGYIAGDGARAVVTFPMPVTCGQDGDFYSTAIDPPLRPISLRGGDGPPWPYGSGPYGLVSADAASTVYMAVGPYVARSLGSAWSKPVMLDLIATDLAVSPYGDIAVSGYWMHGPGKAVAWFDFKSAAWSLRTLGGSSGPEKVDVEWDRMGNLGVAYSALGNLKFDYLDMGTGFWTTEVVNTQPSQGFLGAALAFDRFGNPVIASGQDLFYDPASVPEPSSIFILLTGMAGLVWRRRRMA